MRKYIDLRDGWLFSRRPEEETVSVSVPHTWNSEDGQDGGNDYYRGVCRYTRTILKNDLPQGRIFLEVQGAFHTAEVLLNGECLKRHTCGYSAFRTDLTDHLKEENLLEIRVDNRESAEVYPQRADFTFYGGLYRPVSLICVPEVHFELEKDGTPGIKVTPELDADRNAATVRVETWQNGGTVTFSLNGMTQTAASADGHAEALFRLDPVHLWDGTDDPYLYTVTASLDSGDEVRARFGCREFGFDSQKGFFLNGRSYPLRGVSRHQDRKGKGNALSYEDHASDMAIIREMGANTIRLAHYQHAQEFYDLCDENGVVVWAEIPYITMHMSGGRQNTLDQMRELIVQNYNHPSIAVWGLSNEITAASAVNEELLENHRALNDLCHRLDPTRKTTMADVFMLETDSPILDIPDVNSYNLYFGWYVGEMDQTDEFFDEFHEKYPDRVVGFSEYGADANPAFHSSEPDKGDYTEEYQALYHEHMLKMIDERPYLWATHVWNMFDFAADGRDEGGKHGENQKGLVTFDRRIRKDAFYLYKAAWNRKDPFVHLCGSRYRNRCEDETEIKVYSNLGEVTLFVDGKEFETQRGERIFRFRVPICGTHTVTAKSGDAEDTMEIVRVTEPDASYQFQKKADIANWFDSEIDPAYYSIQDTLGALRADPKAGAVVNAMMEKAASSRGDVADAVKDNPALQRMLGRMTLASLLKQGGADEESIRQLNRILQTIPKEG